MSVPILEGALVAYATDTWNEPFEFFVRNEHTPLVLATDSLFEIVLQRRGCAEPKVILRPDGGSLYRDGHRLVPNWEPAAIDLAGCGTYDFQILEHRADGVVLTHLLGALDVREGV